MTARHVAALGALAALWGASYLLIKYALEDFEPAFVVFVRTAIGASVLVAVVAVQGGARRALGDVRARPGTAALLGASAIAVPFVLIAVGELEVPSGLAAVLIAPAPLFVALMAPLLDRSEAIGRSQALGLVVGLAGVALLVGMETVSTPAQFIAAIGVLGAAASYALSSFVVKGPYAHLPAISTSSISVGVAALLVAPAALATAPAQAPGLRSVLALVALGVAGTAVAFALFYWLIAQVGAGRAALVAYLIPPFSLAYGALLLDERITPATIAGLVAILAGVWLASGRRPQAAPEGAEGIAADEGGTGGS